MVKNLEWRLAVAALQDQETGRTTETFFDSLVAFCSKVLHFQTRALFVVGLEDSTALYRHARLNLVNLANFNSAKKPMKYGTWSTLPTWPIFFRLFGGPRRLDATLRQMSRNLDGNCLGD